MYINGEIADLVLFSWAVSYECRQIRWVSVIALPLAAQTLGRTTRDAIRCRTPTNILQLPFWIDLTFRIGPPQCNEIFPKTIFNAKHKQPAETKDKVTIAFSKFDRNMFSLFFAIKLINSSYVRLIFGMSSQSLVLQHICSIGAKTSKNHGQM